MNGLIIASIVINGLITAVVTADMPTGFMVFLGLFVGMSVVGAIMIAAGKKRSGAILVGIGCVIFVPIGLIGVIGARKVIDQEKRAAFESGGA